jgi:hypothetical protein
MWAPVYRDQGHRGAPHQGLMSSLADTCHNNPVRRPSVSASVRNASRRLSDSRIGVCPMAGKRAGGFGSTDQFVLDGVIGYFRVVLHPLKTIHGQPLFHTEKAGCLHGVCSLCGLLVKFPSSCWSSFRGQDQSTESATRWGAQKLGGLMKGPLR